MSRTRIPAARVAAAGLRERLIPALARLPLARVATYYLRNTAFSGSGGHWKWRYFARFDLKPDPSWG